MCRYRHKAHLVRRCKHLQEDHPDSPWAFEVQQVLRAGLDLRDRCNAGQVGEHVLATARGRLVGRLARLIDAAPRLDDAERFARHLATEFDAVFLFPLDPSIDATNWRAEQAIRPAVVIRKVCGGNRTREGADTQQVLASVVRTTRQRDLDLPAEIATMMRSPVPVASTLSACRRRRLETANPRNDNPKAARPLRRVAVTGAACYRFLARIPFPMPPQGPDTDRSSAAVPPWRQRGDPSPHRHLPRIAQRQPA